MNKLAGLNDYWFMSKMYKGISKLYHYQVKKQEKLLFVKRELGVSESELVKIIEDIKSFKILRLHFKVEEGIFLSRAQNAD